MTSARLIQFFTGKKADKTTVSEPPKASVLEEFATTGIFIRQMYNINDEIAVINDNSKALATAKIALEEDLRTYYSRGKLLPKFKFRPATLIKEGLAINTFLKKTACGLLISVNPASTMATHFYKNNVLSLDIPLKKFNFVKPLNTKEIGSRYQLLKKLEHNEERRCGKTWDNKNRLHGRQITSHSESLLTYNRDSILGLTVPDENPFEAIKALQHKRTLDDYTKRNIPFFHYYPGKGLLQEISEAEMTQWGKPVQDESGLPIKDKLNQMMNQYPPLSEHYVQLLKNEKNITHIHSSVEDAPLSAEHPLIYRFSLKDKNKNLYGECRFQQGVHCIEIAGNLYHDRLEFSRSIERRHQVQLVSVCNNLFQNAEILAEWRISSMRLVFTSDVEKCNLTLICNLLKNHPLTPTEILKKIGYDIDELKWKVNPSTANTVAIRLYVPQYLDIIVNHLQEIKAQMQGAPTHKRMRFSY